jgi:hypothetical protein
MPDRAVDDDDDDDEPEPEAESDDDDDSCASSWSLLRLSTERDMSTRSSTLNASAMFAVLALCVCCVLGRASTTLFPLAVGDVGSHSAAFSHRANADAVSLRIFRADDASPVLVADMWLAAKTADYAIFVFWVDSLAAGTRYVARAGEGNASSHFRTAGSVNEVVRFGATSCLGNANRPWLTLSHASRANLSFMALLGDSIYADGSTTIDEIRALWSSALRVQGMVDLLQTTPLVATWDDHEITDDFTIDNIPVDLLRAGRRAFKEAIPAAHGDDPRAAFFNDSAPLWRTVRFGPVDLFVLDTRSDRSPTQRTYISAAQMRWITHALRSSTAPFKFILNSIPITDMTDFFLKVEERNFWTYHAYVAQRRELLAAAQGIPGVVFLSGDVHFGALFHVGKTAADPNYGFFEVVNGPGGSRINPMILPVKFLRIFDVFDRQFTKLITTWSFTLLTCDPSTRTVHLQFVDDLGGLLWETEIDVAQPTAKITHRGWNLRGETDADQESLASLSMLCGFLIATAPFFLWP